MLLLGGASIKESFGLERGLPKGARWSFPSRVDRLELDGAKVKCRGAEKIVVGGASAVENLAASRMLRVKRTGFPTPLHRR